MPWPTTWDDDPPMLKAGDQFTLNSFGGREATFEVLSPADKSIYSPTGLGGTAIFRCRQLSGEFAYMNFATDPWTVGHISYPGYEDDFCGDSIIQARERPLRIWRKPA